MPQRSHWNQNIVNRSCSLREASKRIDKTGFKMILVTDDAGRLLGILSDGDIRRALLSTLNVEHATVGDHMNTQPVVLRTRDLCNPDRTLPLQDGVRLYPVVDDAGKLVDVLSIDEMNAAPHRDTPVVMMAGGIGERLRPLTDDCPKPMLNVGCKPILQTLLESFIQYGFHRFYIIINYRGDMIKQHFGDGSRWNVSIEYIEERQRLGTAGGLRLLPAGLTGPIIVTNGDILTKVRFDRLLKFHEYQEADASMCVREYAQQVPYGVVQSDGFDFCSIQEKPVRKYLVSAGIYVLNHEVIQLIPAQTLFHMTDLFQAAVAAGRSCKVFPVCEYWIDVGIMTEYERANHEYDLTFGNWQE